MRRSSEYLLVRLQSSELAMFRFLLEAYDNLAFFTVLERQPLLIKIVFAGESRAEVLQALGNISSIIQLDIEDWPF